MVGYMREHFRCNGHKIVAILRERSALTILAPSGATILNMSTNIDGNAAQFMHYAYISMFNQTTVVFYMNMHL